MIPLIVIVFLSVWVLLFFTRLGTYALKDKQFNITDTKLFKAVKVKWGSRS